MKKKMMIAEGLLEIEDGHPVLIGSHCRNCGERFFPEQDACSSCSSTELERVSLGNKGKLWTWTVQHFMPKAPYDRNESPETYRRFGVGYVEFPSGLKVEGRLTEGNPENLKIGMEMQVVLEDFRSEEDHDVVSFAFAPIQGNSE